jgi:hypothetical protein
VIGNFHSENPESIGVVHHLGRVSEIRREVGDRHFVSSGDEENLHFRIAKSDFPKKGELRVGPS